MIVLVKLVLAHLIGDFLLQTQAFVNSKEGNKLKSWHLYAHSAIHGVLAWVALGDFKYWWLALILMVIHGLIDLAKLTFQSDQSKTQWFVFDQVLHLISILGVWYLYTEIESLMRFDFFSDKTLIYITAIYFLTQPVAIILAQLLKKWSSEIPDQTDGSLVNAGKYIGMLERLYVFGFVLSGNIQAIGFLIAAKSVFRFGDLKESKSRKLTEYILIGTLLSFGIAVVSGLLLLKIMESYKGI